MGSGRVQFVYLLGEGLPATVIDSQVLRVLQRLGERGIIFDLLVYQPHRIGYSSSKTTKDRLSQLSQRLPGRVSYHVLPSWLLSNVSPDAQESDGGGSEFSFKKAVIAGGLDGRYLDTLAGRLFDTLLGGVRHAALQVRTLFVVCWVTYKLSARLLRGVPVVLHARSSAIEVATLLRRLLPQIRLVADFRGDSVAEYVYAHREYHPLGGLLPRIHRVCRRFARNEVRSLRVADSVQCVSKPLARRLKRRWPCAKEPRVIPCLADERLFYYHEQEGKRQRVLLGLVGFTGLIYCGSMTAWQVPGRIFDLYKNLTQDGGNWKLIIVTPQTETASRLAMDRDLSIGENVLICSARHDDIRNYLVAADVAVLMREPHPLNQVASPTKFAEYTMCGLPVITSRGIGDLDQLVAEYDLGELLDSFEQAPAAARRARELSQLERERLAARARMLFSLESVIDSWSEVYRNVYRSTS